MARQYTGWLDDQGGTHETQEAAEAADAEFIRVKAREVIKGIIYRAIDWRNRKIDIDEITPNAATLVTNLEALAAD